MALSGKVVNPFRHLASLEEVSYWERSWDFKAQFHFLLTLLSDCRCSVTSHALPLKPHNDSGKKNNDHTFFLEGSFKSPVKNVSFWWPWGWFLQLLACTQSPTNLRMLPAVSSEGYDFHSVGYGRLHKAHLPASTDAALQSTSYPFKFMTTECELQTQITNSLVLGRPLKKKKNIATNHCF